MLHVHDICRQARAVIQRKGWFDVCSPFYELERRNQKKCVVVEIEAGQNEGRLEDQ
jgi:hypothetical protein